VENPVQFPILTDFRGSYADAINVFGETVGNIVNPKAGPNAPFANPFVQRSDAGNKQLVSQQSGLEYLPSQSD
jgi:hypothetical protein